MTNYDDKLTTEPIEIRPAPEPTETDPPDWRRDLLCPSGAGRGSLHEIPIQERRSVSAWIEACAAALKTAPGPREISILGDLQRHKLLQLRLARSVWRSTTSTSGQLRAQVGAHRAEGCRVNELLRMLDFADGAPGEPSEDIRERWADTDEPEPGA